MSIKQLINEILFDNITNVVVIVSFVLIAALVLILMRKNDQTAELKRNLDELKRSFNDLDEQAKLIVKTDLELNKTQEELDKRLATLNALQRASHLISTTLDRNEVFRRLDQSLVDDLGFECILIATFDESFTLQTRTISGFKEEDPQKMLAQLQNEHYLFSALREGNTFSSLRTPKQKKEKITHIFGLLNFILMPVLSQDGMIGILFAGNNTQGPAVTEGDEELVAVLCNQIGQSLENATLFEQVYRSRQSLESKIQDRTKELAQALENVKRISKAKSEFVSAVSHELRTPLTSIKGYASILMAGKIGEIPDQVKERLAKIDKHSDNLVKLINDLLDISRIESGRVEMKFVPCNIFEMFENLKDLFAPQVKAKNITLFTQVSDDIPEIVLDKSQFERVFINLLGNAIKFTPENGKITVTAQLNKEGQVLFKITDTGVGISEEDIAKLFDEFYRVDNEINQQVKGTGLGLALAKNIIEAHKGKIWVTSKLNEGTTFQLTVPITQQKKSTA